MFEPGRRRFHLILAAMMCCVFPRCGGDRDTREKNPRYTLAGEVRFEYRGARDLSVGAPVGIYRKEDLEKHFSERRAAAAASPRVYTRAVAEQLEAIRQLEPVARESAFFGNPSGLELIEHLRWRIENVKAAVEHAPDASYFFEEELPNPIATVETNSEGRFSISFEHPGEPVVITSVVGFATTGIYEFSGTRFPLSYSVGATWAVELSQNDLEQGQINLTPRNDTTSGNSASILHREVAFASLHPD